MNVATSEPKMNGFLLPGSIGVENGELVATYSHDPVDDLEPLEEEELSRQLLIRQQTLLWFLGFREGSLADIAREFDVSRAVVSRYSRQIAEKTGLPPIRNAATAERCRQAQLARRKKDPARSKRAGHLHTQTEGTSLHE